jgi:pimeloyl-ACP methyl ester carboxylesterase
VNKNIYIFSGLGADERVFQYLDFSGFSISFIKWIIPKEKETIEDYATRLKDQITAKRPTLIGLSFGGLMAVEVARQIETEQIILIASAKTRKEIPFYYHLAGQIRLHKLLPARLLKQAIFISNWFFGATSSFDKQLLKAILYDTDPVFLKWAIDKVVSWKNQTEPENIQHIHGTADRILPFHFIKCDFKIKNGGHFMTINKATELTQTIRAIL